MGLELLLKSFQEKRKIRREINRGLALGQTAEPARLAIEIGDFRKAINIFYREAAYFASCGNSIRDDFGNVIKMGDRPFVLNAIEYCVIAARIARKRGFERRATNLYNIAIRESEDLDGIYDFRREKLYKTKEDLLREKNSGKHIVEVSEFYDSWCKGDYRTYK